LIKAELIIDDNEITCNGVKIEYQCGDGGSVYYYAEGDYSDNDSLEQAVKYCLSNGTEN